MPFGRGLTDTDYEDRLQEIEAWIATHDGALPKQSALGSSQENRLARFLKGQQANFKMGKLREEQLQRLRKVPGMEERIKQWTLKRSIDEMVNAAASGAPPAADGSSHSGTTTAAEGSPRAAAPPVAATTQPGGEAATPQGAAAAAPTTAPTGSPTGVAASPGGSPSAAAAAAGGQEPSAAAAAGAPDPAIEALLPPDAPPNSEAHSKVVFRDAPNVPHPFAYISYVGGSAGRVVIQATVQGAGSRYNAERIVRACYQMLEEGSTKDEVLEFRNRCYERLNNGNANKPGRLSKVLNGAKPPRTKDEDPSAEAAPEPAKEAAPAGSTGAGTAAASEDAPAANPPAAAEASEDAPEGHAAWKNVHHDHCNKCCRFRIPQPGSQKAEGRGQEEGGRKSSRQVSFQTTIKAAGGSVEEAARIARLCYIRFERGDSKEEVLRYRDQLYIKVPGGCLPVRPGQPGRRKDVEFLEDRAEAEAESARQPKPKKRTKHDEEVEDSKPKKRKKGGEEISKEKDARSTAQNDRPPSGSVQLAGRAEGRINSKINGVYVPLAGGFEGGLAYEKRAEPGGRRLFLFFALERKRWKVSDKLGDVKGGFAFVKASNGARPPVELPDSVRWSIWDGKESGYTKDENVRCSLLAGTDGQQAAEGASQASALGASTGSAASSASSSSSGSGAEDEDGEAGGDSDSGDSASSAASATTGPSAGVGAGDGAKEAAVAPAPNASPKALLEPAAALAGTRLLRPTEPPPKRGRVCAKMLVRSGLRCICHFEYVLRCPSSARHGG